MKSQNPISPVQVWVYVKIFPLAAWIAIAASIVVFALLIYLMAQYHEAISLTSGVAISFVYMMQLGSGSVTDFTKMSSRIGLLSWAFGCFLVYSYYDADLTANMTSRPPGSTVRSV